MTNELVMDKIYRYIHGLKMKEVNLEFGVRFVWIYVPGRIYGWCLFDRTGGPVTEAEICLYDYFPMFNDLQLFQKGRLYNFRDFKMDISWNLRNLPSLPFKRFYRNLPEHYGIFSKPLDINEPNIDLTFSYDQGEFC